MHKFVEVLDNPHYLSAIFKTIVYPDFGLWAQLEQMCTGSFLLQWSPWIQNEVE